MYRNVKDIWGRTFFSFVLLCLFKKCTELTQLDSFLSSCSELRCGEVSANYPHLNGNISMTTANWDSLSLSLSHVTTVTVTRTDRLPGREKNLA